ncbi:2,3-diphosphoglycerate-dependent phosphoglycerate mutase [Sporolactobacillus terrae]|uniref:2,3-bisphosphoglycerate-dependent phosphoglycerate mutase n=1 Tax=Sporolactobacillus terrae TaxID=269673 RepID=A0A410D8Z0_9BACL|nr:2,3-diphosphoglycerate-dependent phosphoglycerate mutase [Sporolactobacillus terrae]QAA22579.1 2,3-diphosphoglycerate-dependent phosphoglycerate mutase [Sporolactobacillus terrae]QAA25552.1 2,3-diphosphoglycerate-dependent phosphoglycerate mutase [Sporolactobacillus terrae]UAK17362.1 2,3-diphosphoglycerate-dependent phosphoglycerate mutase [Sporolactobacillus terrae]BBN98899.1 2,3-bisphosphoglycerate-dependent phosphoglycerate mutase [Sporolactobacillus terrae]
MKLVVVRHGESEFNELNLFSGWEDVDLTNKGIKEAKHAGALLANQNLSFDAAFTSVLKRSIKSLNYILERLDQEWIPVHKSWRLNERSYGALQRLNKAETAEKEGKERVNRWRKSYDALPPMLNVSDPRHPVHDRRYHNIDPHALPGGESLKTTLDRVLPFWTDQIAPLLRDGNNVLVVSHRNTLRALVKHLENLSDEEIVHVDVPTGVPVIFEFDQALTLVSKKELLSKET